MEFSYESSQRCREQAIEAQAQNYLSQALRLVENKATEGNRDTRVLFSQFHPGSTEVLKRVEQLLQERGFECSLDSKCREISISWKFATPDMQQEQITAQRAAFLCQRDPTLDNLKAVWSKQCQNACMRLDKDFYFVIPLSPSRQEAYFFKLIDWCKKQGFKVVSENTDNFSFRVDLSSAIKEEPKSPVPEVEILSLYEKHLACPNPTPEWQDATNKLRCYIEEALSHYQMCNKI